MALPYRWMLMAAVLVGAPAIAAACLWDRDTLRQERSRFPTTLELITGKFLRHSKEFYEWRIADRQKKLAADPRNAGHLDDLAVAYEKTGQHDKAVETMLAKEEISPGLYETYSNLGTFHILAGDFELGLPYIDKALAINPDAHFGRERYQKLLVEYAMKRRKDSKLELPLRLRNEGWGPGFQEFLAERFEVRRLSKAETQQAVKGVLGMMRFANYRSPLLLEALGDLLLQVEDAHFDAKQLAARAYLMASFEVEDQDAKDRYRELVERALVMQTLESSGETQLELPELEKQFARELADANAWYEELKGREIAWIRDGKDADAEFDRLYPKEPIVAPKKKQAGEEVPKSEVKKLKRASMLGAALWVTPLVLVSWFVVARIRRMRRAAGSTS